MIHPWTSDPDQALQIQEDFRKQIRLSWDHRPIYTIGGVDIRYKTNRVSATIVVLGYPDLTPLESVTAITRVRFPNISELFSFREGPAVLSAWEKLNIKPDLLMFKGQGIAHPHKMGIASHMGLCLERPAIGITQSKSYGHYGNLGPRRGNLAELLAENDSRQIVGMALRTRSRTKPIFASPGHLINLNQSIQFVFGCCLRYRLPEPLRWAHRVAGGEKLPRALGYQLSLF